MEGGVTVRKGILVRLFLYGYYPSMLADIIHDRQQISRTRTHEKETDVPLYETKIAVTATEEDKIEGIFPLTDSLQPYTCRRITYPIR